MANLKTNYKDDVLNTEVNERRKYQMIQNDDGTVSFVDVTDYSQVGDSFGALDINATNEKCNEINSNLTKVRKLDYSKKVLAINSFVSTGDGIILGYVNIDTSSTGYYQINIGSFPIYFATSQGQSIPVFALISKDENVNIVVSNCEVKAYFVPFIE